jgi:glycosyltransferase involved in cell wall biosynthesis
MLGAARAFRPDAIVQSVASVHTGIMAFIAARLGVPFIYRIACDSDVNETRKTLLLPYERISYAYGLKSAELVICQNGYQVAQMDRLWPGKRLLRVANTIRAPHEPQQLHGRAKRSYVAWLGIFREQKNLPLLLRAAKALPEVEFRVAGMPCKSTTDEIRGVLNELSKLQNVRIMGYLRRVSIPEFLGRATALLCTSDFEGFSNAFLEAFAAGTPVLTREGVDPDSIIQRHALGYVARSEQDLIADVDRLSRLPAEDFDLLAANCRAYVEAHHAPRRAMTEVAEAVRSLIESRRSSSQTINRGSGEG